MESLCELRASFMAADEGVLVGLGPEVITPLILPVERLWNCGHYLLLLKKWSLLALDLCTCDLWRARSAACLNPFILPHSGRKQ